MAELTPGAPVPADYRVFVEGGRGGHIRYSEPGIGDLRFPWDFVEKGVEMEIVRAADRDDRWARTGAPWAVGRREEILNRVIARLLKRQAQGARVHRGDDSVLFEF